MFKFSISARQSGFESTAESRSTLRELWQARHIVSQLIRRDLTVRYRQTWLGWLWAIFSPMMNLMMYYVVFGMLVRLNSPDYHAPYALVLLSGLLVWALFQSTVNSVSDSLLNNIHLVKKIYFPRAALTLAGTGVSLADFTVSVLLFILLAFVGGYVLEPLRLLLLPICAALVALTGWGFGCVLAVAKLRFRDVRHLVPLIMQALFYATPVVWTPGLLPEHVRGMMMCNPLYGLCALFRYVLLGGTTPSFFAVIGTIAGSVLFTALGYGLFVRYEARVIDRE